MGRCTVTTDKELAILYKEVEREAEAQHKELASLYREVQRKVEVQQKELLLMEEQNMRTQLKERILEEVTTHIRENHATNEQRCQPQDAITTRDRKDEPRTEISSGPKEIEMMEGKARGDKKEERETKTQPLGRTRAHRSGDNPGSSSGISHRLYHQICRLYSPRRHQTICKDIIMPGPNNELAEQ